MESYLAKIQMAAGLGPSKIKKAQGESSSSPTLRSCWHSLAPRSSLISALLVMPPSLPL